MQVFLYLAGAFALLITVSDAGAQFPGEVRANVVDVLSGRPVASAEVRVVGTPMTAISDASGALRLRGLEPGKVRLLVRAPGYARLEREIVLTNGPVATVLLELVPQVLEVDGVVASVEARPAGARTLFGEAIRSLSAATVGEIAATIPGLRIESTGRGGREVPTIRGSAGDAVLVLVDGVPINDPITGEADLSTVPAASVSALHVLPGGRSARYGARAEGGVILLETSGGGVADAALGLALGSLGEKVLDGSWRSDAPLGSLELSGGLRQLDGGFDFDIPTDAGGGRTTRVNAQSQTIHARVEWAGDSNATAFRLGVAGERLGRGLPGRSFAPSRHSEQALDRIRLTGSLDWAPGGSRAVGGHGYAVTQTMEHRDPDPPFGDPYDERTTLSSVGGELRAAWSSPSGLRVGVGVDAQKLDVRSTQLADEESPVGRTDVGGWLSLSTSGFLGITLSGTVRADRSGLPSRSYFSHDAGLAWVGSSGLNARIGHRSSFSPPTLGDQFFREGVGVEPNPDLEAERVPSEWVVALAWEDDLAGPAVSVEVEAYRGDVDGMIVWLPDFRFVWSPENRDVRRHGAEIAARARSARGGWDARGHVAWNRTTYDRPGLEDTQVVYRPEFSGGLVLAWTGATWRASTTTEVVGGRYPVPNRVNRLPAFWTADASLARRVDTRLGDLELGLHVDRIFDHEDSLIFAYPDPGRTVRLTVRLAG